MNIQEINFDICLHSHPVVFIGGHVMLDNVLKPISSSSKY